MAGCCDGAGGRVLGRVLGGSPGAGLGGFLTFRLTYARPPEQQVPGPGPGFTPRKRNKQEMKDIPQD